MSVQRLELTDVGSISFIKLAGTRYPIDMPVRAGDVHGEWAVHRNPNGAMWRVTHVPTGRSIASLADDLTRADASLIAVRISQAVPVLRVHVFDKSRDDGMTVDDEDRRLIEAIVAEVIGHG